jgi:nitroreductase
MNPIFKRVSIRKYQNKPVPEATVEMLLKAALQAPSAKNQQAWRFIAIDSREILDKMVTVAPGAKPLKEAAGAIVTVGINRGATCPQFIPVDLAAATQNILLQAVVEDLGAVWIGIYPEQERMAALAEILRLEDYEFPFSIVAFGYQAEYPQVQDRWDVSKVSYISEKD